MIPAAAMALVAGTLLAAAGATSPPAPSRDSEPATYRIDDEHTHVAWSVDRFGFARTLGSFLSPEGEIRFDASDPTRSSVEAKVSMSNLRSDLAEREEIVRGKFWVNAAAHPQASFRSTQVRSDGFVDGKLRLRVEGLLDFAGHQAPVVFRVTVNKQDKDPVSGRAAIGISAQATISRKAFGMMAAPALIGDEIEIRIEAVAIAPAN